MNEYEKITATSPKELAWDFEKRAKAHDDAARDCLREGHYTAASEQNIIARTLRECAADVALLEDVAAQRHGDEGDWSRWCDMLRAALNAEMGTRYVDWRSWADGLTHALKAAGPPK